MKQWAIPILALAVVACGGDAPVEPEPSYPAEVTLSPETLETRKLGRVGQLVATVVDQHGETMDTVAVTWSSTDTMVATVDDAAWVYAWATGNAEIAATAGTVADTATVTANLVQRDALTAIYDALGGDGWTDNEGWLSRAPLNTWHGVTTNRDGDVTRVELVDNGLKGTLPIDVTHLESLEHLNLGFNDSIGGVVFPEFGQMEHLRGISLHHGLLTGPLPRSMMEMDNLEYFWWYGTGMCSPPDEEFQRWLNGLRGTHRGGEPCD